MRRLNPSVTKKLIWLAFLTAGTFFVTSRANHNEVAQLNQLDAAVQSQPNSAAPPTIADIPPDYRSTYEFIDRSPVRKKR